ncbi:MAG: hypothetical protein AAB527_01300 [Patescibacteria group bacterium]
MNPVFLEKIKLLYSKYFYAGIPILVLASGALYLFWPMLSGRSLFPPSNIGLYHYMYFAQMQRFVYDLGTLPNWWPAYDSGYPINLTLDAFLNPVFIIVLKYLSPFLANNLMVFVFFVINGLGLYALARALQLSRISSLIAAISYAFSGVVMQFTPTTGIVAVMPFLPLSFLCCLKILQGKTKWVWPWLALLLYSWIGGWSEIMVYALVAVGFFAVYIASKEKKSGNFSYKHLILFFGAIILSVIILLPWFLSMLYFITGSNRSGGTLAESAGYMPTTLSHFAHMFYPRLSVFYGELLPFLPLADDYLLYIGTLPLILVFASFFIKAKKEKGHLVFFIALAMGSILMTVNNSPLFWLFHQIPVLKWFGGYWKWSFVIVFSLAILAGYGMDNIKDFFKNRFSKYAVAALWTLALAALIGISAVTIFDKKIQSAVSSYGAARYGSVSDREFLRTDDYYRDIIKKMSQSLIGAFSFKNEFVVLTIILWLIALIHVTLGKYELIPQQKWRMLAVLITFMGSVFAWTDFYDGPPVSYLKTEPETAQYLHSINPYQSDELPLTAKTSPSLTPYRIFLYLPDQFVAELSEKYGVDMADDKKRGLFNREMMDSNMHIAFNFDAFQNHQTLAVKRLIDAYNLARRQEAFTKESYQDKTPFEEYIKAFSDDKNMRFLGGQNIQYILTPFKLTNGLEPIFTARVIDGKVPVYVYENPYFMPRWYFADKIIWTEPDDEKAFSDLQTIDDFKKTTLLEKQTLNDPAITSKTDFQDELELQLYTAGKLIIKTKTKNYRFLVFSESRFPDFWQATISGINSPIYTANYLYQAVLVPPGENTVEFNYPKLWEQGLISAKLYLQSKLLSQ